jgi:hypothetical protein
VRIEQAGRGEDLAGMREAHAGHRRSAGRWRQW